MKGHIALDKFIFFMEKLYNSDDHQVVLKIISCWEIIVEWF